jgi:hypothetical protein
MVVFIAMSRSKLLGDKTAAGEADGDIFKERGLQFTAIIITRGKEVNCAVATAY